jgi:hypothetical protein
MHTQFNLKEVELVQDVLSKAGVAFEGGWLSGIDNLSVGKSDKMADGWTLSSRSRGDFVSSSDQSIDWFMYAVRKRLVTLVTVTSGLVPVPLHNWAPLHKPTKCRRLHLYISLCA